MKVDSKYTNDSLHVLSYFQDVLKEKHHENAKNFFEREIEKKSKINLSENKATIEKLHTSENHAKKTKNRMNKFRIFIGLCIAVVILFVIGGIVLLILLGKHTSLNIRVKLYFGITSVIIGLSAIIPIIFLCKKIKKQNVILQKYNKQIDKHTAESWEQVKCVNELFDAKHTFRLIEQTLPMFKINDFLDTKSFYPWSKHITSNDEESIIDLRSGSIKNNPFISCKKKYCEMISEPYTGSIVTSWQETIGSGQQRQTYTRTETVSATIYKPKPVFNVDTYAILLHDIAQELDFKSGKKNKHDKNKQFAMENNEFDKLFPTTRNSEQQYRTLFTPLAQEEMVKLLKHRDDYVFEKQGKLNTVYSKTFNEISMSADPKHYYHNDFDTIKNNFIKFNIDYFYNLYFALAPILTIPLFQQMEGKKITVPPKQNEKFSYFEHESIANNIFGQSVFSHTNCATDSILKTKVLESDDTFDLVEVTAHGYKTIEHIQRVSKTDSRGVSHSIPVKWIEYIPVHNKGTFVLQESPKSLAQKQFNYAVDKNKELTKLIEKPYKIGSLLTYIPKKSFSKKQAQEIIDLLLKEKDDTKTTVVKNKKNTQSKVQDI